jgi:hypothetical protein
VCLFTGNANDVLLGVCEYSESNAHETGAPEAHQKTLSVCKVDRKHPRRIISNLLFQISNLQIAFLFTSADYKNKGDMSVQTDCCVVF